MGILTPDLPLPFAEAISFWANWVLVSALAIGVIATWGIVMSASVKEAHWEQQRVAAEDRISANERMTAEANARAAEANQKAETERVERLKLEAKYAPRLITEEQVRALEKSLVPLQGQTVDVVSYESLGTDVAEYAFVLTANLNHAGLHAIQFTPFAGSGLVWGVVVQTEDGSSQEQAAALAAALKDAGIPARLMGPYPVGQPVAGGYMGPTGATPTAKLRLLVGAKPQPNPIPSTP